MDTIFTETGLQIEYETLAARVAARRAELAKIMAELKDLAGNLADCDDSRRPALVQKRSGLAAERDALNDEIHEIERRRNVAQLSIFLEAEERAQAEVERFRELLFEKRTKLNELITQRRVLWNVRGKLPKEESDVVKVELSTEIARLTAEGELLQRDAFHAKSVLERAQLQTAEIRQSLGVNSPAERKQVFSYRM